MDETYRSVRGSAYLSRSWFEEALRTLPLRFWGKVLQDVRDMQALPSREDGVKVMEALVDVLRNDQVRRATHATGAILRGYLVESGMVGPEAFPEQSGVHEILSAIMVRNVLERGMTRA